MEQSANAQIPIREAHAGDAEIIAEILAEAFADDPVMNWAFKNPRRYRDIFFQLARGVYLRCGFGHVADNAAATLWLPAGVELKVPLMTELRLGFTAFTSGGVGAVLRDFAMERVMSQSHPDTAHYYLFAVGVRDKVKGKGIGGRIIREGLKHADEAGAPAYLENSNPKNTPFYEQLGFKAIAPLGLPAGAPPLLGMLRPVAAEQ